MSLKLKELRKSKKMKKIDFSREMKIDIRTITNWEKKDGVVPSLEMMKEISKVLGTNTYEIFSCFVYGPDDIEEGIEFHFHDHTTDIHESFRSPSRPFQLLQYIKEFQLTGEGFIIYKYKFFRFKHLCLHNGVTSSLKIDESSYYSSNLSDGFVAEDENANSIILTEKDILDWRILSYENKIHTVFEITTNALIFPEMVDEMSHNGKCIIYLDAYRDFKESFLPYHKLSSLEIIENTDNVIGTVIRKCRERKGFTLIKLSQDIQEKFSEPYSSKTISRWETGKLKPSAKTLAELFIYFDLSAEKVLDAFHNGFYANSIIEPFNQCYYLGLNLLFGHIKDYSTLQIFINNYIFLNMSKYSKSILIGHVSHNQVEEKISELSIEDNKIVIDIEAGWRIILNEENLINIVPISTHINTCYELSCEIASCNEKMMYTIYLLFNYPKPKSIE